MAEYNEYSDSDDDIRFGPYTIQEAKKDVRKYLGKKVNRRHSTICQLTQSSNSSSEEKYTTASENASTDTLSQNSEFLEKLTKVINEPFSEASSYTTAFDQTDVSDNKNNEYEDTFLERFKHQTKLALDNNDHPTLVENTIISNEESLNESSSFDKLNDESYNSEVFNSSIVTISDDSLSQTSADKNKDLIISKSPIIPSQEIKYEEFHFDEDSPSHSKTSNKSQVVDHTNSLYDPSSSDLQRENQVCYSLLDESKSTKHLDIGDSDVEPCNINLNGGQENLQNSFKDISSNFNIIQDPQQRYERVIVDCNQLSKISEKTEYTTCTEYDSSVKQQIKTQQVSTSEMFSTQRSNSSETEDNYEEVKIISTQGIRNISFSSNSDVSKASSCGVSKLSETSEDYDYSQGNKYSESSKDSQSSAVPEIQFDDTLEDMNRFLEEGNECVTCETTPPKDSSTIFSSNSADSKKILSTSSLEKCKKFFSAEKITTPSVEVKGSITTTKSRYYQSKLKPPSISAKKLFTKHTEKLEVENFKVPTKPVKKIQTPNKLPNPVLKNVVSPIGVYIRHSPKYCPMIKIPQNVQTSKLIRTDPISVKENIPCTSQTEFRQVIYRPAKTKITKEEKEIVLPGSIKKLIRDEIVTKHEGRIQDDRCNQSIERKLLESDLTIDLSENNQDISILTSKQAFNIKKF